jgi:hypothetical protein
LYAIIGRTQERRLRGTSCRDHLSFLAAERLLRKRLGLTEGVNFELKRSVAHD